MEVMRSWILLVTTAISQHRFELRAVPLAGGRRVRSASPYFANTVLSSTRGPVLPNKRRTLASGLLHTQAPASSTSGLWAPTQASPRFVDFGGRSGFQVPGPRTACLTSLQL